LVKCHVCNAEIKEPVRVWSIIDQVNKKGIFNEIKVGLFECKRCGAKDIKSLSRQQIIVLKLNKWLEIQKALSVANKKVIELEKERVKLEEKVKELKEELEITKLEITARALEREVEGLRRGKLELEREISRI
jgi:hypothetical protein